MIVKESFANAILLILVNTKSPSTILLSESEIIIYRKIIYYGQSRNHSVT